MIVADTNLLVYLFLPGPHTPAAEAVLKRDPEWWVPLLWRSEFRNVLALYLRKGLLPINEALDAFQQAEALVDGREFASRTPRVLDLVRRSTCSAYDCEFVALAEELGVPLVTSDSRILKDFPQIATTPEQFSK
ncbi:MAG TPA: type II toxin-antitoxin system VapC family toxin [Longimicrobium sp.]